MKQKRFAKTFDHFRIGLSLSNQIESKWRFEFESNLETLQVPRLVTERSLIWLSPGALPSSDAGQVVHTHVPLSPSSIIWYWPKESDALWLQW